MIKGIFLGTTETASTDKMKKEKLFTDITYRGSQESIGKLCFIISAFKL